MNNEVTYLNFECTHNTAERTMTLSWEHGVVELVVCLQTLSAVFIVRGDVRRRLDISEMSIEEFMRIEEQCQESAEKLAVFNQEIA